MIKMHEDSIKQKLIKEFISLYDRAPTQQEIKALYNNYNIEKPNALMTGILSGSKQEFQLTGDSSSASIFNNLLNNMELDFKSLLSNVSNQKNIIENNFRSHFQKLDRLLKEVKRNERNINKNLLLYSKDDIFTYGIVENFDDYSKVNFDNSNVDFFNGKATLGFSSFSAKEKGILNISYDVRSRSKSLVGNREINKISDCLYEDGSFFKVISYSTVESDVIDFIIDLNFNDEENKFINTLKITTGAIERNSKLSYKCLYTQDNNSYTEIFDSGLRVEENEMFIEINKPNVKRVKIVMTKHFADYKDADTYAYAFALDYVGMIEREFKIDEESVLYLGPYEIKDENDEAINFSMATLKGGTCCIVPDKSSINFYLSKDNVNWNYCNFDGTGREVIQFNSFTSSESDENLFDIVDANADNYYIANNIDGLNINLNDNEYLLNIFISNENKDKFIKNSLKIKRNILNKFSNQSLYNSGTGWYYDHQGFYNTIFEIQQPEGRYFNFGNNSCFINDKQVNGKVFVPQGTHTFKTNSENYKKIDIDNELDVNNAKQLKLLDKLYPYNHKYIIEGFKYNPNFLGRKVYNGADEVYSFDLKEVSNQRFILSDNLDIFTIVENDNGIYFKINSQQNSSEIKLESFRINCKKRNNDVNESNLLYIKAILKSSDIKVTPKIDQIQVRVI